VCFDCGAPRSFGQVHRFAPRTVRGARAVETVRGVDQLGTCFASPAGERSAELSLLARLQRSSSASRRTSGRSLRRRPCRTVIHDRGAWSRTVISELVRDGHTPSGLASRHQNHATNALTYDMNPSTLGATNACSRSRRAAQSSQNVHARTSPPVMRVGCPAAWTKDHIAEGCASGATTSQRG
jgi:hypothetical protein